MKKLILGARGFLGLHTKVSSIMGLGTSVSAQHDLAGSLLLAVPRMRPQSPKSGFFQVPSFFLTRGVSEEEINLGEMLINSDKLIERA